MASLRRNLLSHLLRNSRSVRNSSRASEPAHSINNRIRGPGSSLPNGIRGLLCGIAQRSVAGPVVEGAARDDRDVVREVERGCYAEHGDEEEEDRVCWREKLLDSVVFEGERERGWEEGSDVLKTNFSVGVSM